MPIETILEVRRLGISFTQYGKGLSRRTLNPVKNLNLALREGEMTAVVGASGSGKSLLAHAILGIMPYNCRVSGEILYRGEKLTEKRLKTLRGGEIALVPQGVSYLDPLMRVGEQVRKGKKDGVSRERCRKLLSRFGLDEAAEQLYPFELSGGMARRVLIASALMENPRLVIADEPTPGLELNTARRVMGHFREIAGEGAAVLFITHDLELALETADRIMVFYEGEIIEEVTPEDFGSPERLMHPYTRALYYAMPEHGFAVPEYKSAVPEHGSAVSGYESAVLGKSAGEPGQKIAVSENGAREMTRTEVER